MNKSHQCPKKGNNATIKLRIATVVDATTEETPAHRNNSNSVQFAMENAAAQ
jgi:hypothetical protein